jgi:hypothetical protein
MRRRRGRDSKWEMRLKASVVCETVDTCLAKERPKDIEFNSVLATA